MGSDKRCIWCTRWSLSEPAAGYAESPLCCVLIHLSYRLPAKPLYTHLCMPVCMTWVQTRRWPQLFATLSSTTFSASSTALFRTTYQRATQQQPAMAAAAKASPPCCTPLQQPWQQWHDTASCCSFGPSICSGEAHLLQLVVRMHACSKGRLSLLSLR